MKRTLNLLKRQIDLDKLDLVRVSDLPRDRMDDRVTDLVVAVHRQAIYVVVVVPVKVVRRMAVREAAAVVVPRADLKALVQGVVAQTVPAVLLAQAPAAARVCEDLMVVRVKDRTQVDHEKGCVLKVRVRVARVMADPERTAHETVEVLARDVDRAMVDREVAVRVTHEVHEMAVVGQDREGRGQVGQGQAVRVDQVNLKGLGPPMGHGMGGPATVRSPFNWHNSNIA